jgi:peptidyl-prolyl cis-trans isomerase A (cyclophilin A)
MVPLPRVLLATSLGNVELELNQLAAPITVNNFLDYVNSGFYRNTLFHRAIAGFVVQGGGYTKGLVKKDGQKAPIVLESNVGLQNTRGTVAMARTSELNSATSEFYVNLSDNASLDYLSPSLPGYAVFGKVLSGMDVIDSIAALPTATVGINENVPTTDVTINFALQTQ